MLGICRIPQCFGGKFPLARGGWYWEGNIAVAAKIVGCQVCACMNVWIEGSIKSSLCFTLVCPENNLIRWTLHLIFLIKMPQSQAQQMELNGRICSCSYGFFVLLLSTSPESVWEVHLCFIQKLFVWINFYLQSCRRILLVARPLTKPHMVWSSLQLILAKNCPFG